MQHTVKLLDSTLREGEQTPGVDFTLAEKVEIAELLDRFGVDYIEAGHPAVSEETFEATRVIADLGLKAEVVAHSRAMIKDIDLVLKTNAEWVGVFFSVADKRLEAQFRKNEEQAIALIRECVSYAKDHGLKVRYTPEDTVRSDPARVHRVARAAAEAGADRISVADTTGFMTPTRMFGFVSDLRDALAAFPDVAVGVHCHDDLGMAVANSLAAVEAGASVVDVTVNGLGERTGIPPLATTATALRLKYGQGEDRWDLATLPHLSDVVARHSTIPVPVQAPITGRNAFSHNAGLHVAAVLMDPTHYESIPAELVGRTRRIVLDKMAGRPTCRYRLEALGIQATDEIVDLVLSFVKRRGVNDCSDEDLRRIHEDLMAMREVITNSIMPAGGRGTAADPDGSAGSSRPAPAAPEVTPRG